MFKLKNVRYKNILDIGDLAIYPGKITAIVGKSGSGKTTLLKLLNQIIDYDHGTIIYQNADIKSIDTVMLRREVLMVPQAPAIFPGTIKDNLLIGLIFANKEPLSDEVLLEELKKIDLDKNLEEAAEPLSGGEKQRIALARVILMKPKVLLLDEPTAALDEKTAKLIIQYINRYLKDGNNTLVLVTHSRPLARQMGNTIVTLNRGTIAAVEEVP